jgi:nondiscriminating glutamyl-tRNA synthetase
MNKENIRVRFAPSPTGELHLGNARTAIFNWLFARNQGGKFILRIEDTDQERSKPEYEKMILEDLKWLGLNWDEGAGLGGDYGPYLQSQRLDIYRSYAEKLRQAGHTYLCYCSSEELEARRQEAQEKGLAPRYDNRCRLLTKDQIARFESEGRKSVVRFKVDPETIVVNDLVRGRVEFDTSLFGDFVIFKSDGFPTFHFAVAVDDGLMKVSHVIRGEDHLPNTPRHILLFKSMGFEIPDFAHLSMILGPDGSRLSKRHGATSVGFYRQEGYLPQAMVNYLALLGWSSGDDQEVFEKEELISKFSIERVVGSAATFNPVKLHWMGEQHIRKTTSAKLAEILKDSFQDLSGVSAERLTSLVEYMKERAGTLSELKKSLEIFLQEPSFDSPETKEKLFTSKAKAVLNAIFSALEKDWTENLFPVKSLSVCQKQLGVPGSEFYPLLRLSLTGHLHGPELKDFCPILGKENVLNRLKRVIEIIPAG